MKFDLSLLVPSWLLDEENVKQFLLAVQENLNELALEVDDLWYIWEIWKAESPGEWFEKFLEKIGMAYGLEEGDIRKIIDAGIDFLRRKGSILFFEKLMSQLGESFKFTDMVQEIMVLSSGRKLSQHYLQDRLRYRDGAVICETGQSGLDIFVVLRDKFVPLGVYLWLVLYASVLGMSCYTEARFSEVKGLPVYGRGEILLGKILTCETTIYERGKISSDKVLGSGVPVYESEKISSGSVLSSGISIYEGGKVSLGRIVEESTNLGLSGKGIVDLSVKFYRAVLSNDRLVV